MIGSASSNSIRSSRSAWAIPTRTHLTSWATSRSIPAGCFLAPTDQDIADAYTSVSLLLTSEYLITFDNDISDCAEHVLKVKVITGQTQASANFTPAPNLQYDARRLYVYPPRRT